MTPTTGRARILLADDEESIRQFLRPTLENAGYEVTTVANGECALHEMGLRRFDLLLLDVQMPGVSGLEVLARMHESPSPPRAIVMTGDPTPAALIGAVRGQAFQMISKPFGVDALLALIGKALASNAAPIEVLSATPQWIELLVPCERETAERVHEFLMRLKSDLSEEVREAVGHAFRELLLNAIEWGGGLDPARRVRLSFVRGKNVLIYRIADPGQGFRIDQLPHAAIQNPDHDPIQHVEVRERLGLRPGGLGILIARSIVDELIYNEAGNEVLFVKYVE